jgi:hypothetical protein
MNESQIAWYAAVGGWVLVVLQLVLGYWEKAGLRDHETFITGLKLLSSSPVDRSIGLSIVEALWPKRRFRRLALPALVNLSVYLLLRTEAGSARHEFHNWLRVIKLLRRSTEFKSSEYASEVCNAFLVKVSPEHRGGIAISTDELRLWAERLHFRELFDEHVKLKLQYEGDKSLAEEDEVNSTPDPTVPTDRKASLSGL